MNKNNARIILASLAAGALGMGVVSCASTDKAVAEEAPVAAPTTTESTSSWLDNLKVTTPVAAPVDPYSTDGEWLVPGEIQPGQYKAIQDGTFSGYVAVCADLECEIDMDGSDATGLIDNYTVDGQAYVTVPQGAMKVELNRAHLVPVN